MRAVHENVRKHRCEFCEFTSFASSALKRHILAIHEKRKPFECDKVNTNSDLFLSFVKIVIYLFLFAVFVQEFIQRILGIAFGQQA